jgi:hypothetical protein
MAIRRGLAMACNFSCDRCKRPIEAGRTLMRILSGPLTLRLAEVDLCPDCVRQLEEWLARGRQATAEAPR